MYWVKNKIKYNYDVKRFRSKRVKEPEIKGFEIRVIQKFRVKYESIS